MVLRLINWRPFPRNTSNAEIAEKICIPYDKLLKKPSISRIIQQRVVEVRSDRVILADQSEVPFAYCVVATGKQWMPPNE